MPAPRRLSWTIADTITVSRLPLAVAFPIVDDSMWRLAILAVAAGTDLLDGPLARRFGSSRFGAFLDPLVDKLFMASAFGVVLFSGKLKFYEIIAVLARDIAAAAAFFALTVLGRPISIPARPGGKAVTVAQSLTITAFLMDSPLLRPLAWATGAIGLYAIWDYQRVARQQARPVGQ
jgi:CDP-diacylglycerol---glycerol-3-phosphate 3-phosphatidyltransferase